MTNGNTLITEGSGGRIIEVTIDHEIVWESISPYRGTLMKINMVYRAYRLPYDWVPQLEKPEEMPIKRLDPTTFRVPGARKSGPKEITEVEGVMPFRRDSALCVLTEDED